MTDRTPMHQQIDTLPDLVRAIAQPFDASARNTFDFETGLAWPLTATRRIPEKSIKNRDNIMYLLSE